jgi:hypothetical protein
MSEGPDDQWRSPPPPQPAHRTPDPGSPTVTGPLPFAVVVDYQLDQAEATKALRWVLHRVRGLYAFLVLGILLIAVGLSLLSGHSGGLGATMIVLGVYALAIYGFGFFLAPQRLWRKNPGLRGPQSISFSERGVWSRSVNAETRADWSVYRSSLENEACYLLRMASRPVYLIVPKRAFADTDTEVEFRRLIAAHTDAHLRNPFPRVAGT